MKTNLDCIPCFLRQALQAARFATADEAIQEDVLRKVVAVLLRANWKQPPPQIAHIVHKMVRDETAERDPYLKVKKESNDRALKLYPSMKILVKESKTPLLTAIQIAIAGNIIDFGAITSYNLKETVSTVLKTPLKLNSFSKFVQILSKSRKITYLGDNAGEIVFDKLLLETILDNYPQIEQIQFVVKGTPILNDATIEDAIYVGLNTVPNLEFIEINTESRDGMDRASKEFLKLIADSDMTISKGQGNYEALSSQEKIFFLLLAKCPVVAKDLGVEVGDIILKGS